MEEEDCHQEGNGAASAATALPPGNPSKPEEPEPGQDGVYASPSAAEPAESAAARGWPRKSDDAVASSRPDASRSAGAAGLIDGLRPEPAHAAPPVQDRGSGSSGKGASSKGQPAVQDEAGIAKSTQQAGHGDAAGESRSSLDGLREGEDLEDEEEDDEELEDEDEELDGEEQPAEAQQHAAGDTWASPRTQGSATKDMHRCSVCSRLFNVPSTLRVHMRTHTGERPYGCPTCGRAFSQRGNLTKHMRIHTGTLPFSCDLCGRRFRQRGTLTRHRASGRCVSATLAPRACSHCTRRFRHHPTFLNHLQWHGMAAHDRVSCHICSQPVVGREAFGQHCRAHEVDMGDTEESHPMPPVSGGAPLWATAPALPVSATTPRSSSGDGVSGSNGVGVNNTKAGRGVIASAVTAADHSATSHQGGLVGASFKAASNNAVILARESERATHVPAPTSTLHAGPAATKAEDSAGQILRPTSQRPALISVPPSAGPPGAPPHPVSAFSLAPYGIPSSMPGGFPPEFYSPHAMAAAAAAAAASFGQQLPSPGAAPPFFMPTPPQGYHPGIPGSMGVPFSPSQAHLMPYIMSSRGMMPIASSWPHMMMMASGAPPSPLPPGPLLASSHQSIGSSLIPRPLMDMSQRSMGVSSAANVGALPAPGPAMPAVPPAPGFAAPTSEQTSAAGAPTEKHS